MNNHFLSDIIFQSKQLHKQRRFSQKSASDMFQNHKNSDKNKNLCLLGSLEFKKKQLPSQTPFINKFQIVQLRKNKFKQEKQKNIQTTHFQSQLKTRQIHSYRNSFKIKKLQNSQIGMFQKGLASRFLQNSVFLSDKQLIRQTNNLSNANNLQDMKINLTQRNSSLNIQTLPSKFIPNQGICSLKSQQTFYVKQRKLSNSEKQFQKKNLFLDFNSLSFNPNDNKSFESPKKFRSVAQIQDLLLDNSIQQRNQITRQKNRKLDQNNSIYSQKINNQPSKVNYSPRRNKLKKIQNQQKQFQQRLEIEKKIYLEIRKQVNKFYGKPFNPPQNISAQSYIVYETTKKIPKYRKVNETNNQKRKFINGHKVLVEFNSRTPFQIASLTKIMTFLVVLQILSKYSLDPSLQLIKIGYFQQRVCGTSANLQNGQIYTLQQLFYGLMLPSGNDASIAIAVWGGQTILKNQKNGISFIEQNVMKRKKLFYQRFLEEMNRKAGELGLQKTHFANSHGLINSQNKSCAFDLALLCQQAMKNQKFREVVQTRRYECTIKSEKQDLSTITSPLYQRPQQSAFQIQQNSQQGENYFQDQVQVIDEQKEVNEIERKAKERENNFQSQNLSKNQSQELYMKKVVWQNTHFLLHQKPNLYKGIKTGVTNTAGPCLASFIEHNFRQFIIIVLNCRTMKQRFRDTQNLRKWTFQKQQIKFQQ